MKAVTLLLSLGLLSSIAHADTILSGNVNGYFDNFNSFQVFGESFTTSTAYANVSVSVYLSGPIGSSGTAYLTTSLGPGTTPANQIAAATFSPVSTSYTMDTLFSGITLPAGTIYLTLSASSTTTGMDLEADYPTSVTTGSGVTFNGDYLAATAAPYPPATSTSGLGGDFGSVITGSPVPEPATFLLLFSSGAPLIWVRKSR